MSNFVDRAKARPNASSTVLLNSKGDAHFPVVPRVVAGKTYNLFASQQVAPHLPNLNTRISHLKLPNPLGALNGNFENASAENEFRLDCGAGKKYMLRDVYLMLDINNSNTGGTTTLSNLENCFEDYVLMANGSNTEIDRVLAIDWLYRNYLNLNTEELAKYGAQSGWNTSFAHSRTIGTTSSTGLVPVRVAGIWNYCDFYLPYFDSLNFRFRYAGATKALVSDGTGGSVTVSKMEMLFVVEEQSQHAHEDLMARLKSKDGVVYRVIQGQHFRRTQALANATSYDYHLTSLRGIYADLMFCFRQSEAGASSANITFENVINNYDIKDSTNASLYNGQNKLSQEALFIDSLNLKSPIFATNNRSIFVHQFVSGGIFTCEATKCKVLGYEALEDAHLEIVTNSTPAGNTYIMDIIGHAYVYLCIDYNRQSDSVGMAKIVKS